MYLHDLILILITLNTHVCYCNTYSNSSLAFQPSELKKRTKNYRTAERFFIKYAMDIELKPSETTLKPYFDNSYNCQYKLDECSYL
jgi:hypothetical protein